MPVQERSGWRLNRYFCFRKIDRLRNRLESKLRRILHQRLWSAMPLLFAGVGAMVWSYSSLS